MEKPASNGSTTKYAQEKLDDGVPRKESMVAPLTLMEKQIALQAALKTDPGVKPWSWAAIQMYLVTLVVCCCAGDGGFDGTVMSGINSMTQYQRYFGLNGVGKSTSIVFGIFTIGSLCGTIPAAYLPDRFGRRVSMFFGNTILIAGAILTANAKNKGMFLGGRLLTGLGSTCAVASGRSYLAEMTPAQSRGAYMGFMSSFYHVGQMAATGMMVSTGKFQNDWSWRLPLYVQVVPAAINMIFVFLCPESPRWLHSIGKTDEARRILTRFHSSNNDINSPLVDIEMKEIEETIRIDDADKRWWDFRPLFRTRADRYRTYMVILVATFGPLSGNALVKFFLPILLHNAGVISQQRVLTLNFVNTVTSYIGTLLGSFAIDRFGRRNNLLLATGTLTIMWVIVSALLSNVGTSVVRANAGISFIYLFGVVVAFGWTPMQVLYPTEVLGYEVRAKGLAFYSVVTEIAGLINTFGLPVALQKIGWKVYLIFLFWDAFEVVVIYFFVVETKGLTLEEINDIFDNSNPRKYSEQLHKETRMAQRVFK